MQMAVEKSDLLREGSTLRSKLVAEKQHSAVLQVHSPLPPCVLSTSLDNCCYTSLTQVQGISGMCVCPGPYEINHKKQQVRVRQQRSPCQPSCTANVMIAVT